MKAKLGIGVACVLALLGVAGWLSGQQSGGSVVDSFKLVEVASVADAIEQLYGTQNYMWHDMRPLFKTKFVGPAVTVYLKKEEHKEGTAGTQASIDAIDTAPAGSVYVIVVEDGLNYGALGGLMGTTLKYRGIVGAVVDASIRDLPQLQRIQFPIFSRGVSPGTTVNHYRATMNVPVMCAGVKVNPGDLISADEDGVVVIPKEKASEILTKSQELDYTEHATFPFIEKTKSLAEAVKKFGRL
ncbi:MAG TPA: RraA family protein [Bryobacteraceae bacterium]|nr:RraA family protein [Bryobacteraceae bacterium]